MRRISPPARALLKAFAGCRPTDEMDSLGIALSALDVQLRTRVEARIEDIEKDLKARLAETEMATELAKRNLHETQHEKDGNGVMRKREVTSEPRNKSQTIGQFACWVVVGEKVVFRQKPCTEARVVHYRRRGSILKVSEWDVSRCWRWARDPEDDQSTQGWVLLDSAQFGPLLRPQGCISLQPPPKRNLISVKQILNKTKLNLK